jgi:2-hydroxychromene-2-carboxylate isomerase
MTHDRMTTLPVADWYFDYVSPFAYLQFAGEFPRLRDRLAINCVPVLFAGLLNHWGQKGPAEIAPKRVFTFQFCAWWAARHGVPYILPAKHPFNPLGALRLTIALDSRPEIVGEIFRFIWGEGRDVGDPGEWAALARRLDVDDHTFWGVDATEMACDYLGDRGMFGRGELARATRLPVGAARRQP